MILSSFVLRLIALVTMTIDHIGYFLYPREIMWRIIGRLAFPIFLFLTNEAYKYTHDKRIYASRLLVMGCIMHAVMVYADGWGNANIFITLAVCFIVVWSLEEKQYLVAALALAGGIALDMDYGIYAVGLMLVFHYLDGKWPLIALGWFALDALGVAFLHFSPIQHYSLLAMIPLLMYNHKPGTKKFKYLFYAYYPLHISILYLLERGII